MAYSVVGIVNMAVQRIGAKSSITALTDGTPNALKANAVWEYIRDEVMEEIKPRFATLRRSLSQSATAPANTEQYDFAYPLPNDYLCLADDQEDDPAIWPSSVKPYSIETLRPTDETLCLMTNYDSTTESYDIYLTYVKKIVDPAKYAPSFVNAFADRLGAELALAITESTVKFGAMMERYERSKKKAKALNREQIYLEKQYGSDSWETAGR